MEKILDLCDTIIKGFDLNDKFGNDIDARHMAEIDGVDATHEIKKIIKEHIKAHFSFEIGQDVIVELCERDAKFYKGFISGWQGRIVEPKGEGGLYIVADQDDNHFVLSPESLSAVV